MQQEIENAMERIRTLTPVLNQKIDELDNMVDQLDKWLMNLGVATRVSVPIMSGNKPTGVDECEALVYERIIGVYHIGIKVNGKVVRWRSGSKSTRAIAGLALTDLIHKMSVAIVDMAKVTEGIPELANKTRAGLDSSL